MLQNYPKLNFKKKKIVFLSSAPFSFALPTTPPLDSILPKPKFKSTVIFAGRGQVYNPIQRDIWFSSGLPVLVCSRFFLPVISNNRDMLGLCFSCQVAGILGVAASDTIRELSHQVVEICLCYCVCSEPTEGVEVKHVLLMWAKSSAIFAFDYVLFSKAPYRRNLGFLIIQ